MITAASRAPAFLFQINQDDLGPLFVDTLRLPCNGLSPFGETLRAYAPGSRAASAGLGEIVHHPRLADVAHILTQPDLRMIHRTGGGSVDVSYFGAFRNRAVGQETIVTVTPSFEGSWLVQRFEAAREYLAWWLGLVGTKVEEPAANYLPPPMTLESLVYLLHAIDCFRRVSYAGMLSYSPLEEPSISPAEFSETMTRALGSRDVRWLLPAFLYLTPGLDQFTFEPRPEHLAVLGEHDVLLQVKHPQTGQEVFIFGEAGRTMGVEFYRTWMMAVGFDTTVLTPQGERSLNRGFLAPTALANHLIRLEPDGRGGCTANHQALTLAELEFRMRELLDSALAAPVVDSTAAAQGLRGEGARAFGSAAWVAGTPSAPSTAQATCRGCGNLAVPGARFCPSCGSRL